MSIINQTIADSLKNYDETASAAMYDLVGTGTNQEPSIDQLIEAEIETALGLPPDIPNITNADYVKKFKFRK